MNKIQEQLKRVMGLRVTKARTTMNYSQTDVLEELGRYGLGRTQGSLSLIEHGKRLPSVEMLYVLAKYLETSTDYLLGLTHNELAATDIDEDLPSWDISGRFNRIMGQLPRPQQQQVVLYAEYLFAIERGDSYHINRVAENIAAWNAAVNVIERKYGTDVADDVLDTLARNVPGLEGLIDPGVTPKKKRIN